VSPAYQVQDFDDLADKVESGYAGMPVTPKATTPLYPAEAKPQAGCSMH
jgi:hypothetical protein